MELQMPNIKAEVYNNNKNMTGYRLLEDGQEAFGTPTLQALAGGLGLKARVFRF